MGTVGWSRAARASGVALQDAYEYTNDGRTLARRIENCVLAGWIACALMPFAAALAWGSRHGFGAALGSLVITAVIAAAITAAVAQSISRMSWILAVGTGIGTFVLTFATMSPAVVLLGLIQCGALIAAMIARSRLTVARPIVPRADDALITPRVIGEPGVGLMSDQAVRESGMSLENLRKGMVGEQLSHSLFVRSLAEAGLTQMVQIVHGLKFPGTAHADIDHALVCANRVLLVDSKYWAPMPYRWFGDVVMGGVGEDQQPRTTNFTTAVGMVSAMFGAVEVGGAVLIHPNGPGELTVDNTNAGNHPPLVAATAGIAPLLSWLRSGIPADADVYRRLQSQSMRLVLSITDGIAPQVVAVRPMSPITPTAPGGAPPGVVSATLRSTGSEAASIGRWYLARRRRKKAEFRAKTARAIDRERARHAQKTQRRQEQVLRMQHDSLNAERPLWKRKKW